MNSYFFIDKQNQQKGPIHPQNFADLGVTANTMVWCKGMVDWQRAGTIDELKEFIQVTPPPFHGQNSSNQANDTHQTFKQAQKNQQNLYAPPLPNNYLAWAIISTICCCVPFGIIAIFKANDVNKFYNAKHYDEAYLAAESAKNWCIVATIFGILSFFGGSLLALI